MENNTIAVLGLWHLGMITAAGFANLGNRVFGIDPDRKKIALLKKGVPPLFEPDLERYLQTTLQKKLLSFSSDLSDIRSVDIVFFTFDTPLNEKDEVDTIVLFKSAKAAAPFLKNGAVIVVSSQVPVGTTEKLKQEIAKYNKKITISIAYIPENLRLGKAFERFFNPAMTVIGTEDSETFEKLARLYTHVKTPKIHTSVRTAEFVKHAINTYLATSISFANELGNIADGVGANYHEVASILRFDERIGKFARIDPGLGFAGGTLARDLKILQSIGKKNKNKTVFIDAILNVNNAQKKWVVRTLKHIYKNTLAGKKIGILGLTYTPQTSTLRRSLAVETIHDLIKEKATVVAYDPKADQKEVKLSKINRVQTPVQLAENADALVVMTPWLDFLQIDFKALKKSMRNPLILDPNNFLSDKGLANLGFLCIVFGKGEKN